MVLLQKRKSIFDVIHDAIIAVDLEMVEDPQSLNKQANCVFAYKKLSAHRRTRK